MASLAIVGSPGFRPAPLPTRLGSDSRTWRQKAVITSRAWQPRSSGCSGCTCVALRACWARRSSRTLCSGGSLLVPRDRCGSVRTRAVRQGQKVLPLIGTIRVAALNHSRWIDYGGICRDARGSNDDDSYSCGYIATATSLSPVAASLRAELGGVNRSGRKLPD